MPDGVLIDDKPSPMIPQDEASPAPTPLPIGPILVQTHDDLRADTASDRFFAHPNHIAIEQDYLVVSDTRVEATDGFAPVRFENGEAGYASRSELLEGSLPGAAEAVLEICLGRSLGHLVREITPRMQIQQEPCYVTLVRMRHCAILRAPNLHLEAEDIFGDTGLFRPLPAERCTDPALRARFCTVLLPWADSSHKRIRARKAVMDDLALYRRWLDAMVSPMNGMITIGEPQFAELEHL